MVARWRWTLVLAAVALAAGDSASAALYTVDPTRSELTGKVKKAGLLSGLGHDHLLRATEVSGRVDLDRLHPAAATVVFDVADGALTANGAYRLTQSDYGIEPFSAFLGAVTVKDDVDISFRIAARRAAPTPEKKTPR